MSVQGSLDLLGRVCEVPMNHEVLFLHKGSH